MCRHEEQVYGNQPGEEDSAFATTCVGPWSNFGGNEHTFNDLRMEIWRQKKSVEWTIHRWGKVSGDSEGLFPNSPGDSGNQTELKEKQDGESRSGGKSGDCILFKA